MNSGYFCYIQLEPVYFYETVKAGFYKMNGIDGFTGQNGL